MLGSKNATFGYFSTENWKSYLCIWNQHPCIYLIAKFCEKIKVLKFGIKNVLFGLYWVRILKSYCHFSNQHPWICQNWVFNSYSYFWYRVLFLKFQCPFFLKVRIRVCFIKYAVHLLFCLTKCPEKQAIIV